MNSGKGSDTKTLKLKANSIRQDIVRMLVESKSGHPAGSLGMADVLSALYFGVMKHDPKNPQSPDRDRLVLSNAHICPVLYATLSEAGYFPKEKLLSLRKLGSSLQGHPHLGALPGIETSGGPLGQGISQALGMAIVSKRERRTWRVFALLGDGELNEGQVWEAMMLAGKFKLDNLIAIIDRNNIQIDGTTDDVLPLEPLADKCRSFGWHTIEIDGNDAKAVMDACESAKGAKGKPTMVIAKTIPGKGVSFMEKKFGWHGKTPNKEDGEKAISELLEERKKLEGM